MGKEQSWSWSSPQAVQGWDADTSTSGWRHLRTSTTQLLWTISREAMLSPLNNCPVTSRVSSFLYFFSPSLRGAGFTCMPKLDLNPDARQYESHIHKGKADVQKHLIIPPTLLLRREPPDALKVIVCSIRSPYAVPKGCLYFLQRDAGNLQGQGTIQN